MSDAFILTPIGPQGLPVLPDLCRDLAGQANLESLLARESIDLDDSFFATPDSSPTPGGGSAPVGFGLLGVRRGGGKTYCSVRGLAATVAPGRPGDPRPALLHALLDAARSLGAVSITAEATVVQGDSPLLPPAALLANMGFRQVDTLIGFDASREDILAEPVYLQIGLHDVSPTDLGDWLEALDRDSLPWSLHPEAVKSLRFPGTVYGLVASGFGAGFMATTDPQLERVEILNLWVLPDLRRQQVAEGALQELVSSHPRIERLEVPPVVRAGDHDTVAFLEKSGFQSSEGKRTLMEAQLTP